MRTSGHDDAACLQTSGPPGGPGRANQRSAHGAATRLQQALDDQRQGLLNCVHCGFCLPACPTYRRLGDEADSPRGRLYLMQAVVEGRLDAGSDAFQEHVGRCLGCRACEPACPAGVAYGHLLELARHVGREARRPGLATRALLRVFGTGWVARPAMAGARLLRATRFPALVAAAPVKARAARRLKFAAAMLAASAPAKLAGRRRARTGRGAAAPISVEHARDGTGARRPPVAPPARPTPAREAVRRDGTAAPRLSVALLDGCVQGGLFGRVNAATRRVLETNGYHVVAAPGQGCCGALHAHAGDLPAARAMARRNVAAFRRAGAEFIGVNASGCGAAMASYGDILARDIRFAEPAADVGARVEDVSQLLARSGAVEGAPVRAKVACDEPCHLLHAQGVRRSAEALLQAVPGLDAEPLRNAAECCGGAGIYGLVQPELGGWIGGDKVDAALAAGAGAVATGNPGCIMQIGAGLRLRGSRLPVLHPVEILDESYRRGGFYDLHGRASGAAEPRGIAAPCPSRVGSSARGVACPSAS